METGVANETVLYDYWRSSASYRVRIALNLCGEAYRSVPVDLLAKAHRAPEHLARNPQGLVPVLDIDGERLTQSLAIIEYLAETRDGTGLLPAHPIDRQRVRALSYAVAMDIHPVCNLGVVARVMAGAGDGEAARRSGCRNSSARVSLPSSVCWTTPRPVHSAMAIVRRWRISALCPRSTMRGAGMSILRPARFWSP